ncbi:FliH/SctL family protein [Pelagibius sp. Alg239-R121]|uniref:FliH/SctL family protein n=1 Tax=Pelagibius sp. Alg239-R121 TaxID=2993448 RepID=UPI0024A707CD|nr:FliH/SctL family protein [Pelagibius sp. Alg239-R121]
MSANQKFLFDNAFEAPLPSGQEPAAPPPPEPETLEPEISEADLQQAREEGRQEGVELGREEGRTEAFAGIEQTTQNLLLNMTGRLGELMTEQPRMRADAAQEALQTVTTILQKMLPSLEKSAAMKEIESVVSECLLRAQDEPRLVVRVSERVLDAVKARVDALVASEGFEGKIVFLAAEGFGDSDVRVEWADGGAERKLEDLWQDIDQILARFLKLPNLPQATQSSAAQSPAEQTPALQTPADQTGAAEVPADTSSPEAADEETSEAPPLVSPVEQMGLTATTGTPAGDAPHEPITAPATATNPADLTQTHSQPAASAVGTQEPSHD